MKRTGAKEYSILLPLFVIVYLGVLAPWKYVNYLLAPLAPFVIGMLYPAYQFLQERRYLKQAMPLAVVAVSFLFLFGIIMPRISKMADKRKVVEFLRGFKQEQPDAGYFFSQPFEETATLLSFFSGLTIEYLRDGRLDQGDLAAREQNYLIYNDETLPVSLEDVRAGTPVYRSGTWIIVPVEPEAGLSRPFTAEFPRNFLERLKDRLKKL